MAREIVKTISIGTLGGAALLRLSGEVDPNLLMSVGGTLTGVATRIGEDRVTNQSPIEKGLFRGAKAVAALGAVGCEITGGPKEITLFLATAVGGNYLVKGVEIFRKKIAIRKEQKKNQPPPEPPDF